MNIFDNLKNPPKKYRPMPFWSWNEKLDTNETKRQIELMDNAGLGGYFMHARGGLETEYMGEEWFANISVGADEGKKRHMSAWAYDENGWPSGFGNGIINGKGVEYQQKYLRIKEGKIDCENFITYENGYTFYYDVNPFYVDTLYKKATECFVAEIYGEYFKRYGNDIPGFFIDEPQVSRDGIPWSFVLVDEYKKKYGSNLLSLLPELFKEIGDFKQTRYNFWRLVAELFCNNFTKVIYDWCEEHKMMLTGHMVLEEELESQLTSNGAVMPNYEYFHIPGMDWLCRQIDPATTPLQVSSVAHQLGKRQILSETFALTGWNIPFEQLKWMLEWQMVRGITLLCPHLEGYSLRGIRKRDYPPSLFYQQPWWEDYKFFTDYASRIGMLLSEGDVHYDTLLLHPEASAWTQYNDSDNGELKDLDRQFKATIDTLEGKHILFHLGDEIIMEKYAKVCENLLCIGTQKYSKIVIPPSLKWSEYTEKLLAEFKANGGIITTAEEILPTNIVDNKNITMTIRHFSHCVMYYFVNSTFDAQYANLNIENYTEYLTDNGELASFNRDNFEFLPMQSLVIFQYNKKGEKVENIEICNNILPISGMWEVEQSELNTLTLDRCDYSFDGKLQEKNGYVASILHRTIQCNRDVVVDMVFHFSCKFLPKELYLALETPEKFTAIINGNPLKMDVCGHYRDISFKKINIAQYVKIGENTLNLTINCTQSPTVYENLKKATVFESEKNKLTFDTEIESVYLVGDFAVATNGEFTPLDRDAERYSGDFVIEAPKKQVEITNLQRQGFAFFGGSLTLSKKINLENTDYSFCFKEKSANSVKLFVNDVEVKDIFWRPYCVNIEKYLVKGENKITVKLTNSMRNIMGPHHLEEGETYVVAPFKFFKEDNIWGCAPWNDDYCFVRFGIDE